MNKLLKVSAFGKTFLIGVMDSERFHNLSQNGREDIVECDQCENRQYRENGGEECLDCGTDVSRRSGSE